MTTANWKHRDEWKKYGNDFMVMVSRHSSESPEYENPFSSEGPHRWCVYAFIYPKHPYFSKFNGNDSTQSAACALPLHGGPSYLRRHYDDDGKAVTAIQVGGDYNHLHDDVYTRMETRDDARSVFRDAEELFEWLADRARGEER